MAHQITLESYKKKLQITAHMYADFSKKQIFKKKRNSALETCIGQAGFFAVFRHKNPSVARRIANRKYQKQKTRKIQK